MKIAQACTELLDLLDCDSPLIQRQMSRVVKTVAPADKEVVDAVVNLLRRSKGWDRFLAAGALYKVDPEHALIVPSLVELILHDLDANTRVSALILLNSVLNNCRTGRRAASWRTLLHSKTVMRDFGVGQSTVLFVPTRTRWTNLLHRSGT